MRAQQQMERQQAHTLNHALIKERIEQLTEEKKQGQSSLNQQQDQEWLQQHEYEEIQMNRLSSGEDELQAELQVQREKINKSKD